MRIERWVDASRFRERGQLRAYFAKALAAAPELKFDLLDVFAGVNSVAVYLRSNVRGSKSRSMSSPPPDGSPESSSTIGTRKEDFPFRPGTKPLRLQMTAAMTGLGEQLEFVLKGLRRQRAVLVAC